MAIGQDLLNVPFPEMVEKLGLSIAEAQFALDNTSLRLAQMMSGKYEIEVPDENDPEKTKVIEKESLVTFDGKNLSLLELGFTPTFYQFVDTIIEVKISLSTSYESEYEKKRKSSRASAKGGWFIFGGGASVKASSVSARFSSKFQYSAEGSSLLRTKIVTVPTPDVLNERIRGILEREAPKRDGGS